ncbi:iron-binding protein [Agrobacterium rhizogenes]|nr:iron-binding protein [Rhizobium rhizogenes]NTJ78612.1 iron-binding protein [Rhizobium rhizogenes]
MKHSASTIHIAVTRDGPYIVTGEVSLSEQTIGIDADRQSERWVGTDLPSPGPKFALCRCGHSGRKPFCDGTHAKIGFDGTEVADRTPYLERAKDYDGPDLMLLDLENLCAFARFCDPNGQVWNEVAATADPKVRRTFIDQVGKCPAGRLVVWDKVSNKPIEPDLEPSVAFIEDPAEGASGPIWVRGGIAIISADGEQYEIRNRVTLCRCGASSNKPYCDGTHASIKFQAK